MTLSRAELARYVDHTLLAPTATAEDVRALLAEAQDLGAERAWLQVEAENAPAIALYAAEGFEPAYLYRYWTR